MNKILKKIGIALAVLIILAAVFSSTFRALTPWAKQYKGEVEQHLSSLLGQKVTVKSMETGWYWFQPVLKLSQVSVEDGDHTPLHLEKLLIGIDLFKSLWRWQIQPGALYIDHIHLDLREKEGHWTLDGISGKLHENTEMTPERTRKILMWLTEQGPLIIRHVSVFLHLNDGGIIPVSGLNLSIVNNGGNYKLKGEARLLQTNVSTFQVVADVRFNPFQIDKTAGHIYFSAKKIALAQWKSLIPKMSEQFKDGKGDLELWVDLKKGAVSLVQTQLKLKGLILKNNQLIQSVTANASWNPSDSGWQFQADKVRLRMNATTWPENKILLKYDRTQELYQLYVKSIIPESLVSLDVNWPDYVQNIIKMKPHGLLSDSQIVIREKQPNYILTRFDQLGWTAPNGMAQVKNLSGVLHWQPEEGRLELDSENSILAIKGYPEQKLSLINGAFDWKELSDGLRVSIEHLVLSQPELTLSAEGVLDQVTSQSLGNMSVDAEFSGKNFQQWIPLIPDQYLKPKLALWLKKDVKRIANASGKLHIKGMARDFPFDTNNGILTLISHVSGVELYITSKWQLITDLEGYFRLKSRNLDIDVVNGNFQGAPVKQMNLRINDIGKDKEILLIHGLMEAPAQKILDFILASPLSNKLFTLKNVVLEGLISMELRVDIPLYTEEIDILAKGDLHFKNNRILFHHQLGKLKLEDVSGNLAFDEKGVNPSALIASVFGYPFNIKIQSVQLPIPATQVLVDGECTIESLAKQFNPALFAFLKGKFFMHSELTLTNNPEDFNNLVINTNLQGLAIQVPAPLGKAWDTKIPLEVKLDFNSKKGIRVRANYDAQLSTDLLFRDIKGNYALHSGQVRLGSAYAVNQNKPGLGIVGKLDGFDLEEWNKVIAPLVSEKNKTNVWGKLRIINVTLGKFTFLKQQFDQMAVIAKLLPDNSWSLNVKQKNIAGDLTYSPETHSVSGHMNYLHLAALKPDENSTSSLHPEQIPNLNFRIDNLKIGEMNIGAMTLKSHSSPERWLINYCRIESPEYQFNVEGSWTQKEAVNATQVQVKMQVLDLAKSLERWSIIPAVSASKGEMEFRGGWKGSLVDFSLASLNGQMYLQFKNGIITHLSPETEEKLGLGKLLSILSLQTIPRRLKLDFSDLSKGYSFDVFKGNFTVAKGIMNTQDSYLDGPVAYASMKGDLDLVKRLYDLNLRISPHITASLPIVATIAGGPIAGVAMWIANKIINQGMQKISAYSYKISGPWNQPVVQQLKIVRGR